MTGGEGWTRGCCWKGTGDVGELAEGDCCADSLIGDGERDRRRGEGEFGDTGGAVGDEGTVNREARRVPAPRVTLRCSPGGRSMGGASGPVWGEDGESLLLEAVRKVDAEGLLGIFSTDATLRRRLPVPNVFTERSADAACAASSTPGEPLVFPC